MVNLTITPNPAKYKNLTIDQLYSSHTGQSLREITEELNKMLNEDPTRMTVQCECRSTTDVQSQPQSQQQQ